jgi:hypothetical protein
MPKSELSIYVGTDEFLAELRELGYQDNIGLDDLIDFLEEDPSYIEQMRPTLLSFDEIAFVSPILAELQYNRRPT